MTYSRHRCKPTVRAAPTAQVLPLVSRCELCCIQSIAPPTCFEPTEAEAIAATLAFLEEHDRCWQRDNYAGHLTASAWVINEAMTHVHDDIRYLLVAKTMEFVVSEESNHLAWVPLVEVVTVSRSTALRRMAQKLAA